MKVWFKVFIKKRASFFERTPFGNEDVVLTLRQGTEKCIVVCFLSNFLILSFFNNLSLKLENNFAKLKVNS